MLLEWSGSPLASRYNWDTASHVRCNSKNFSTRFDIQMLCSIWFQWKLQWNILKWIFKFLDRKRSEKKYSKVYDFYVNKVEELCCLNYVHWCSYLAIELWSLLVSEKKSSRQIHKTSHGRHRFIGICLSRLKKWSFSSLIWWYHYVQNDSKVASDLCGFILAWHV